MSSATAGSSSTRANEPMIQGNWFGEPLACPTTLAVERLPVWSWDVNCYYRDLGVQWNATRQEVRAAFQALGHSPSSRHTMIARSLLDRTRASCRTLLSSKAPQGLRPWLS